jgi:predicted amidophosphoribosyltransferase
MQARRTGKAQDVTRDRNSSYIPENQIQFAREKDFHRVVIVDDTFTTGTTAAAIVTLLQKHGLPKTCEVIFACPLWLDTETAGGEGNAP